MVVDVFHVLLEFLKDIKLFSLPVMYLFLLMLYVGEVALMDNYQSCVYSKQTRNEHC